MPAAGAAESVSQSAPVVPPLWAASASPVPAGWVVHLCPWLSRRGPDRTLRIALPARFGPMSATREGCEAQGGGFDEWVYVEPAVGMSLRTYEETYIDPRVDEGGDDSISDVVYAADVPAYGARVGETLSYEAYADGSPTDVHYVQAEGVRLRWDVTDDHWGEVEDVYATATAGVGIDATRESSCARSDLTVRYPLDREVRWVDSYPGTCYLILGSGDFRTRAIKVAVRPVRGLTAAYRSLAARDDVRRLRRTSARQLDYDVLLGATRKPRRVRVVQAGAVRLTLTTSRSRWRHDRRLYDELRAAWATSSSSPPSGRSTAQR